MSIFRILSRGCLPLFFLLASSAVAQDTVLNPGPPDPPVAAEEEKIVLSFPNIPLSIILAEYEELTGNRIVRDSAVLAASLSIETSQELTQAEAADFIEKSLLLNGFALIPAGENTLKIIAYAGKEPGSEGIPVITQVEELPKSDEVVTLILPLEFLSPQEAEETLTKMFPIHTYGKFVALDAASALAVTENTATLRKIVQVLDRVDLPPSEVEHKAIELERANNEEVVESLKELLELEGDSLQDSGPRQVVVARANGRAQSEATDPAGASGEREVKPKIKAIPRSNRILVIARPIDIAYIETLIGYFDESLDRAQLIKRKLNYLPAASFLPIARHTLLRNFQGDTEVSDIAGGEVTQQAALSGGNGSRIGSAGGSSFGGGSSRSFSGGSRSSAGADGDLGPQSIVVDNTLIIADNVHNTLLISGPNEHVEILDELLDSMDQPPRQILISAIIAQLTLGDDFEFGADLIRTLETVGPDGTRYNGAGAFKSRTGQGQSILDINTLDTVSGLLPAAQGLTLYGQLNPYLDGFLSTLQSTSRFKVLSRPTIYTLNNRRAEIFTGQRIAVPRSTQSVLDPDGGTTNQVVTASIDFEEVVLRVEVVPLINAEDQITLQISQSNESIVGSQLIGGDEIPTIGTQALETTVIVPNGGTVLLGGLISEEQSKSESGLPLFVNVPFLGKAFGSTGKSDQRQELLIFIQPQIVDTPADLAETQADTNRRSELSEDALQFATPEGGGESETEPVKRGFFKRMFSKDRP